MGQPAPRPRPAHQRVTDRAFCSYLGTFGALKRAMQGHMCRGRTPTGTSRLPRALQAPRQMKTLALALDGRGSQWKPLPWPWAGAPATENPGTGPGRARQYQCLS